MCRPQYMGYREVRQTDHVGMILYMGQTVTNTVVVVNVVSQGTREW